MIDSQVNSLRYQILKGTASGFMIQAGFAVLSFVTVTILARLLSLEDFGAYSNAFAWVNILAVLGTFGFNSLLLRDMAILRTQNKWALMKGFLRFSDGLIIAISMILMFILWGIAGILFATPEKVQLRFALWLAAPLIPLYALIYIRQAAMRGLEQVTRAMLPDSIIRPALTLAVILGAHFIFPDFIDSRVVILLSVIVTVIAVLISLLWLQNMLPAGLNEIQPDYQAKEWIKAAAPMFVIGCTQIFIGQLPTVMLGVLSNARSIGFYAVASRVANLLIFLPMVVGIVVGPMIARLYSSGERIRLQNIIKKTNRLTFALTFLLSVFMFVFAKNILSIFGPEFKNANNALTLLIMGYLIDTGLGMSILTLMMTGHEHEVARYQAGFTVLLVVLCIVLIPSRGYEGAAIAFMTVMVISRFVFVFLAKKHVEINTSIF